ncbi:hypothetical protein [Deinococcus sp. AJ005]|uniref:hypothetical protein n=1 Tax=Deinococcus sp. AJ005 TaxID=2652443 RepID=UPI00125CAD35|nr:hypothetical protein [Deinococcus sp. AJ005]QFP76357.1 hypothetical protein DAAJ005_07740 [Deinococcus sp. AJ005]
MKTQSGFRRFARYLVMFFMLGGLLCWGPMFTAQAQDVQKPARDELIRTTNLMTNAQSLSSLNDALQQATQAINNAKTVNDNTGGGLMPRINASRKVYYDTSIRLVNLLTVSCEKDKVRKDGQSAWNIISNREGDTPEFLTKAEIKKLRTRIENCLRPPTVYKGMGTSTFKGDDSLTVVRFDVTWTLNTALPPGTLSIYSYTPSGTVTVEASQDDCKGSGKFAITAGLLIITLDNEVAALGMLEGDFYEFALASGDILTLKCSKGVTYPMPAGALSSADAVVMDAISLLSGSQTQDGAASNWSFKATKWSKP